MTNFKKVGCVLIISFFYCLAVFSQGLGFQSNDSPIGERTSYTVFGNNLRDRNLNSVQKQFTLHYG